MLKVIQFSIKYPKLCLLLGALLFFVAVTGLHKLEKNTSTDAFIPDDHPSLLSRDRVKKLFGLQDPFILSIVAKNGSELPPEGLNLLLQLQQELSLLDNVSNVKSIASESHINATQDKLIIEPLLKEEVWTQHEVSEVFRKARQMPPFVNTLVSEQHFAVSLIVELQDQTLADQSYRTVMEMAEKASSDQLQVYVAGQGAVGGYLSQYIDADSRKMQPVVVATILILLFLAFRQIKGLIGPLVVIVASAIGAVGTMAWLNVPYYAITSALPVVITAIAVADTIHVLTAYYELKARYPEMRQETLVQEAMLDMARPITLTTITTIAGFIGLSVASIMPPVQSFGLFAALGVALAWLFTMLVLPGLLILIKLPGTKIFTQRNGGNRIGNGLSKMALSAYDSPVLAVTLLLSVLMISVYGATSLRVDRAQVENFQAQEPIRQAHDHIHENYAGSAYLDVFVSTDNAEGLLDASVIEQVSALQTHLESFDSVAKTQSILDVLGVLQRELEETDNLRFVGDGDSFAQYQLLYESSAKPTDYSDKIDNQYQHLLVRAYLNTDLFSEEKRVVEQAQSYIDSLPDHTGLNFELTGRVNVDYHWMKRLGESHFRSIAISLALVLLFASLLFKSPALGLLCVTPVFFAIMVVYGVMGLKGIFLEPATSMFAAIAIGVGVDFSIHFVERLQLALKDTSDVRLAIAEKFPGAARACFFNAAALASGFATLFVSELPTLQRFGLMITLACMVSFFAALLIVPLAYGRLRSVQMRRATGHSSQSI